MQQSIFVNPNVSEVSISYSHEVPVASRETMCGSHQSAEMFRPYFADMELRERFFVMLLNQAQHVLGICLISVGGISATIADVRLILATALKAHATQIIVAHNHPSGNLNPSEADRSLTQQLKTACTYMDIRLLDHVILTKDAYYSFADNGLM